MADEDESQKTEEPTAKRLREAEKKGEVVQSQEVKNLVMLTVITAVVGGFGAYIARSVADELFGFVSTIHLMNTDQVGVLANLSSLLKRIFIILLLPFSALMAAAIVSNTVQHKTTITFEKMKPDLNKFNIIKNSKKYFSSKMAVDFGKIWAKLIAVGGVIFIIVYPERDRLDTLMLLSIVDMLGLLHTMALKLLIGVLIVLAIIAAIDFSFQKYQHHKRLRMTKQEVKDENKQTEGDPKVKGRLRSIRMERARQRMMAAVPDADVVITNPTHFAVALEYKHGAMDVPKLVAKGVDDVALKIREVATEHNVPIVENPPLARALYASVELDEEVPPDHYKAVASVISYVMKMKRGGFSVVAR